jgi:hypothetical protein
MARRRAGRPPKYCEAIHTSICQALELGMSRTTAAEINGINRDTLLQWTIKYPSFSGDVQLAEAKAKRRATLTITTAIQKGDVAAAFRYLALKEREEWRESKEVNVNVQIRQKAERMAEELGVPVDELMETAESIAAEAWEAAWSQ